MQGKAPDSPKGRVPASARQRAPETILLHPPPARRSLSGRSPTRSRPTWPRHGCAHGRSQSVTRSGQGGWPPMRLSLAQAAGTVGRSRSTILRSIRGGKLSAERDELTGAWSIDVAELTRLFSAQANGHGQDDDAHGPDQMRTG